MVNSERGKCALYIRVSTEQQVRGNSLRTQKTQLLSHAKSRNYTVADIYVEAGLSGKNTDRPELQRLLTDAGNRAFDTVIVWAVDRISRSVQDLIYLMNQLSGCGVGFVSISQDFDTSDPVGLLTLHILGSFAQFERELLVERTKEGHLSRLQKQDWSYGPVPLGYRKEDGKLVEIPDEAETVRLIFDLYLKLKTMRAVANQLNADGVRTRRGKTWSSNTVAGILRNPVYTGANVYGRHRHGDTRLRSEAEWTVVPGTRKPMVDAATFVSAQKLLKTTAVRRKKNEPVEHLLSGLLVCGKCGSPMYGKADRRQEKMYRYYVCNGNAHKGKSFCPGTYWPADKLEEMVLKDVDLMVKPEVVGSAQADEDSDLCNHTKALEQFSRRKLRLFELYENGLITKEMFHCRIDQLLEERKDSEAEEEPVSSNTEESRKADQLQPAGPQALLRATIDRVVVGDDSCRIVTGERGRHMI